MSRITREHYRVPRQDRSTYIRPEPSSQPALVERNRRRFAAYDFEFAGRPFAAFRSAARAEILGAARRYTGRWGVTAPDWSEPAPVVVTGHQPPPFHPGVWIKNFLAGSLARAVCGVALNLNVDNDEAHAEVVRMPTRDLTCRMGGDEVRVTEVDLAEPAGGVPFEEQSADDLRPDAVHRAMEAAPSPDVADAFRSAWIRLVEAVGDAETLAEAFVAARRRIEEDEGLTNLELPVSKLADSEAFRLFLAEMVRRREDFFAAYNESLQEYRQVYNEENQAQPVPDLVRERGRMELPYWVWRPGESRQRLWIELTEGGSVVLACDHTIIGRLTAEEVADPARAAERLAELRRGGWKIRPRALSMTLFVRLAVADAFVHGLGGALYDRITDRIMERLFGVEPPELILASCTVHLPLETYPSTERDLRDARRLVRDWRYNPDRLLPDPVRERAEVASLIEEKWRLIRDKGDTPTERDRRWRRVRELNGRIAAFYPDGPQAARRRLDRVLRELDYNAVLTGREYPYLLYPRDALADFYRDAVRIDAPAGARCAGCVKSSRGRGEA